MTRCVSNYLCGLIASPISRKFRTRNFVFGALKNDRVVPLAQNHSRAEACPSHNGTKQREAGMNVSDDETHHSHDVFISYKHAPKRTHVEVIGNWLEDEGYDVWGFGDVQEHLEHKVQHANCVIVLWSPEADKSEWVLRAGQLAAKDNKLLPVIIDGKEPPPEWEWNPSTDSNLPTLRS